MAAKVRPSGTIRGLAPTGKARLELDRLGLELACERALAKPAPAKGRGAASSVERLLKAD
jgi:hypothetical protein